jgi:Family of unknown function (DUF5771)
MFSLRKTLKCPKGTIMRKGYTRKFRQSIAKVGYTVRRKGKMFTVKPKKDMVYVPPACIKDRGLAGKGPLSGTGFGKLRKGELIKYGYQYRLADRLRHKALEKAVKAYGALTVYHKLDAVAKLSARTAPDASRIFASDRDWVRDNHPLTK